MDPVSCFGPSHVSLFWTLVSAFFLDDFLFWRCRAQSALYMSTLGAQTRMVSLKINFWRSWVRRGAGYGEASVPAFWTF